jgi:lambda family phage portal protein
MPRRKLPSPNWFDRALGVFAPGLAYRNWQARCALSSVSHSAADRGADINRDRILKGGRDDRHLVDHELWDLREISREIERNNGIGVALLDRTCENVVGANGYDLNPATGDTSLNQQIEDDWLAWLETCDVTGELHGWELFELGYRSEHRDGDVLIVLDEDANNGDGGLQLIEGDRVFSPRKPDLRDEFTLVNGFVLDGVGAKRGVWVSDAVYDAEPNAISSEKGSWLERGEFFHWMRRQRASATRGRPTFTPIIREIDDLDDLLLFERIGAKLVAAQGYFIETDNPVDAAEALSSAEHSSGVDRVEEVTPGGIHYLKRGSKVHSVSSNRPSDNFEPFVKLINRNIGLPLGFPYELVTLDFSGVNFASSRQLLNQAQRHFRVEQVRLGRKISKLYRWWLQRRLARGFYQRNGRQRSAVDSGRVLAHAWGFPGWPSPNPLQDANAAEIGILNGFESRTNFNRTRGVAQEQIDSELAAERDTMPDAVDPQTSNQLRAMLRQLSEHAALLQELAG